MKSTLKTLNIVLSSLISFLLFSHAGFAQEGIKASAPRMVNVNKAFSYTVSGDVQGNISLGEMEGLRVMSGPSKMVSYQSTNVNGKLSTELQVTYSYLLMVFQEGEYTIPPATLQAGNKTYKSNPVTIKVVADASSGSNNTRNPNTESSEPEPVIVKLVPSGTELYQGEQLVVATKIYVRTRVDRPSLNSPSYEGFWVEQLDADGAVRNEIIDGYTYNSQVVKRDLLTAQRKGEITIEPASLDITVIQPARSRRRSTFDDFFNDPFDRYERETIVVHSNPVKINVKPLPSGAPEGFQGAVGNFKVNTRIKEDSVQTNNAISLIVEVTGKGNLNLLEAPEPDFPPDLEVFEPKRTENINHSSSGSEGRVSFEYVIIPRHNGDFRISPIRFSYFRPDHGDYVSYESPELRFTSYGGENEAGNEGGLSSGLFREDVRDIQRDIRYIKQDPGNLLPRASFLIVRAWVYIYYFGGIAILLLALFLWRNKRKRDADIFYTRNKKAKKIAKKRLINAHKLMLENDKRFYDEILKALWGYLADRLGVNTADLSRDRISEKLSERGIGPELQDELWTVVETCEYSRYSPESSGDKKELYKNASDCLQKMEQKI